MPRERNLARIRKAQGRGGSRPAPAERAAIDTYFRAHPRGTLSPNEADRVARFRSPAEAMLCICDEIAALTDVPAAVALYLAAGNLPFSGCIWPQLARLEWKGARLTFEPRAPNSEICRVSRISSRGSPAPPTSTSRSFSGRTARIGCISSSCVAE